jgi:hypothetical protein
MHVPGNKYRLPEVFNFPGSMQHICGLGLQLAMLNSRLQRDGRV